MTAPRALRGDDLVLSHFSLDRNHPLDDRIASAGAAGFAGIGLFAGQFVTLRQAGFTVGELRDLLDAAGITSADAWAAPVAVSLGAYLWLVLGDRVSSWITLGVPVEKSRIAGLSDDHRQSWDRLTEEITAIKSSGRGVDPSKEIADPAGYDLASGTYTVRS